MFSRYAKPEITEAILTLRSAESAADRAAAARTLGAVGGQRETTPLIAALFDDSPEVRHAAAEALAQIGEPTVSFGPLSPLMNGNVDWGAPEVVQPSISGEVRDGEEATPVTFTNELLILGQPPVLDPLIEANEELLHPDEHAITNSLADLQRRLGETVHARKEAEERARRSAESELNARAQVATRRREEEELRKQAEEEAARHRHEEEAKLQAEDATRVQTENEAKSLAEQESVLRLEVLRLRQTADDLAQRRAEVEDAARAARGEDAERKRREAEDRHAAELEYLRKEEEAHLVIAEQVANRRREVKDARQEAEILLRKLEEEKVQLAADAEAEQQRLAALDSLRQRIALEAEERAEKEQQLRADLERLLIADREANRRIEDAEMSRRRGEEAYNLTAEKLQRLEAEAHARAAEEERILVKLAEVQRNVAIEAQEREEQEKRVREEIKILRRLEEEQRQRLEDEIRGRREAEARLQQAKNRYRTEEEARVRAEAELEQILEREQPSKKEEAEEWRDDPIENLRPVRTGNLESSDPLTRAAALSELAQSGATDPFSLIVNCFDDQSVEVRNAAAWALRELDPARPVEAFTRALDEASTERRQNIGTAIASSGLAAVAIEALCGDKREDTYNALCLLFAMAKTGELEPLVKAVEGHHDVEVRRASVKLLTLAGQEAIAGAAAKRRLDVGT